MTTFWAQRFGEILRPVGPESVAQLVKLPLAKDIKIAVFQPRYAKRHRLFWLICERIGGAIGADSGVVADLLKIETGHCTVVKSARYGIVRIPKSIAFHAMDETQFREFFERCVVAICENWGSSRPEVLAAMADLELIRGGSV